jgi:hypothetical protein
MLKEHLEAHEVGDMDDIQGRLNSAEFVIVEREESGNTSFIMTTCDFLNITKKNARRAIVINKRNPYFKIN